MPIALPQSEWARIVQWTDSGREDPETVRRRDYIKYLNDTSREMTKSWPNSLENVNKRNEEIREARLTASEEANSRFYRRYVRRQREQQARLMHSARDTVFKNKDAPKMLLGAVIETVTQKERAEQCKFNANLRQMAVDKKRKEDDEIIRKAKEWHELNDLRVKRRFEVNKKHQNEIIEQMQEHSERQRQEYEDELNMQKVDISMAQREIKAIKEFEEKFKADEKARIWSDMQRSREEALQRQHQQAGLEAMDCRLQDVLLRSRTRVDHMRKQTEKAEREEKQRVLDAISQKLESGDAARDAKEQAILEKALKEKIAIDDARRQANLRKEQTNREERQASRRQFLHDEEQRLHELQTMRQWELMNRFKNQEIYAEFLNNQREERERKIKEHRAEIIRLWKEREDREARELAETRHFYGARALGRLRDADNRVLAHAAALAEDARRNDRPLHALHKAVQRYCNLYRLYPMPELPTSLQEHFAQYAPQDASQPDPGYAEPPAPPPPDAADDDDREDGRNGLQAIGKAGPSKSKEQKEESVEDYKRVGPANGLQRRKAQGDISLPPIAVVPCKTPECTCELKGK